MKEIRNARSKGGGRKKKNPISTRLITICVQLLNALQAELHALCIVMRSVTEGSSSRETSGESFKVKGMQRVSATAHCDRKLLTLENTFLSAHTYTHASTCPTQLHRGCLCLKERYVNRYIKACLNWVTNSKKRDLYPACTRILLSKVTHTTIQLELLQIVLNYNNNKKIQNLLFRLLFPSPQPVNILQLLSCNHPIPSTRAGQRCQQM